MKTFNLIFQGLKIKILQERKTYLTLKKIITCLFKIFLTIFCINSVLIIHLCLHSNYVMCFFLLQNFQGEGMVPQSKVGKTFELKENLQRYLHLPSSKGTSETMLCVCAFIIFCSIFFICLELFIVCFTYTIQWYINWCYMS